jgi:hypothetical protein
MSFTHFSSDTAASYLKQVRTAFLRLHKALLDSERVQYERVYGRIPSPGEFLRLVMGDEWFNWLRPMSQYIVQIDEILAAKEPVTSEQFDELMKIAQQLTQRDDRGALAEQRYFQATERDPEVAILHVKVAELLTINSPESSQEL